MRISRTFTIVATLVLGFTQAAIAGPADKGLAEKPGGLAEAEDPSAGKPIEAKPAKKKPVPKKPAKKKPLDTNGTTMAARPKVPALVGATQAFALAPSGAFVDNPVASDGAGHLAFVVTSASTTQLQVLDLVTAAVTTTIDLSAITLEPVGLRFVDGGRIFVIARDPASGDGSAPRTLTGVLLDGTGKVAKTFGPATDVVLTRRGNRDVVVLYRRTELVAGGSIVVDHTVEQLGLDGKKVGKKRVLRSDDVGKIAKLDFQLNHFAGDYAFAVGIHGGHWDKKADMRTPDAEGWYDVLNARWDHDVAITDVVGHTQRFEQLAARPNQPRFVKMAGDFSGPEQWRDGVAQGITLDQPLTSYDPASLGWALDDAGALWIAMKVDPVNFDAVKRKKADAEYFDLFAVDGNGAAVRKARVLAPKKSFRWGVAGGRWWLVERNVGMDRGGKSLTIYTLP